LTGKGTGRGADVGLLAGLSVGGLIGGLVVGATVGAIAGSLRDHGIEDTFIENVVVGLDPDRSILFLLGEAIDRQELRDSLKSYKARVLYLTLPEEREQSLRKSLAEEE
jgi:uncharacterized membrane protein